jgi:hypothetical protein
MINPNKKGEMPMDEVAVSGIKKSLIKGGNHG